MDISLTEAIFIFIEFFFYIFQLSVLIILLVKSKTEFNSAFFHILLMIFISDFIYYIFAMTFLTRVPRYGILRDLYLYNGRFISFCYTSSSFLGFIQFFGQTLISLNRFTLLWMPLKHQKIWNKKWYIFLLLFVPFVAVAHRIPYDGSIDIDENGEVIGGGYVDKNLEKFALMFSAISFICFAFISLFLTILTVIKYALFKHKTQNTQFNLLVFSILLLFVQLLRVIYLILITLFYSNIPLVMTLRSLLPLINDCHAWLAAISLLVLSPTTRKIYCEFYNINKITSNAIPSWKKNCSYCTIIVSDYINVLKTMFSSSYYDKLDPTYRDALLKLENDLFYTKNKSEEDPQIIRKFAANYLTPKTVWLEIWTAKYPSFVIPAIYHFAYSQEMNTIYLEFIALPKRKLMNKDFESIFRNGLFLGDATVDKLCFPHNMLDIYLYFYEFGRAKSHLPQKVMNRHFEMKKLYEKIKAVEENEEEWINAMKEADDVEFVKHNIEFKLGQDLTNKKIWNLYIKYLKEYDVQELLQVYSKHCRFFVADIEMKEEYKKSAERYGKATVPWKNVYDFEIFDENFLKYDYIQRDEKQQKLPCPVYFNAQNAVTQRFPFHANLINYLVKNAKANELQKLNFSCKYFYHKYCIPVCYEMKIMDESHFPHGFVEESINIHSNRLAEVQLNNFCISTVFYYNVPKVPLSSLVSKMDRCYAKYITITNQELTFDELKFLIGHGNVIRLCLYSVIITDIDDKQVPLEEILALTPKFQFFWVEDAHYSSNTAERLCEIPFENKFIEFSVKNRTNITVDPYSLGEFINKNALSYCRIYFNGDGNNFEAIVKSVIDDYWKADLKPCFKLSYS